MPLPQCLPPWSSPVASSAHCRKEASGAQRCPLTVLNRRSALLADRAEPPQRCLQLSIQPHHLLRAEAGGRRGSSSEAASACFMIRAGSWASLGGPQAFQPALRGALLPVRAPGWGAWAACCLARCAAGTGA